MSNTLQTKDGAPIPKELRYSYPVDCIILEYSHRWRLLQGENPLTHHHSWLCWDFLLLLDLPCKGIRQHLMALIRIPKFGKFLLVESGILWVQFKESGMQVPPIPVTGIHNPRPSWIACVQTTPAPSPQEKNLRKVFDFSWGEEEGGCTQAIPWITLHVTK